ncbi:MAG: hypothetical protein IKM21_04160 [Oscillospiraceae bacterium]|nr:hypothetical protein [Oscillospiraceae bacterium]
MSNVERKPRKFKIVIVPVIVSLLVLVAVLIMRGPEAEINEELAVDFPFESLKIEYEKGRDTSFAVKIRKEEMKRFLEEKGANFPVVFSVLPEKLDVSGNAKITRFTADGCFSVLVLKMEINGFEIPQKLLSDIGELKLDFKRSLVYN